MERVINLIVISGTCFFCMELVADDSSYVSVKKQGRYNGRYHQQYDSGDYKLQQGQLLIDEQEEPGQIGSRVFYKTKYDQVVAELNNLGENPQAILKQSGFASRWQGKEVKGQPYWVGEITTYATPPQSLTSDKIEHLFGLSSTFLNNMDKIDVSKIVDLRDILVKSFETVLQQSVKPVLRSRINKVLRELDAIKN